MNTSTPKPPRARVLFLAIVLSAASGAVAAQEGRGHGGGPGGEHRVETQRAPFGYQRPERPREIDARPRTFDSDRYRHDFRAPNPYKIGPYHAPSRFEYRRWRYGDRLPPIFWGPDYRLSDFWLFGLDLPPVGYEWVRYGNDAILVNLADGEVVQVVYDTFH